MNPRESVVKLHESAYCLGGTGTLIHPHFIATCQHVFRGDNVPTIFLEMFDGDVLSGLIRQHLFPHLDLIILELAQPVIDKNPITFAHNVNVGEACYALGFPRHHWGYYCSTPARVTNEKQEQNRYTYRFERYPTDKYAMKGASGGPVINAQRELIAMQQSSDLYSEEHKFYGTGVTAQIIFNMFMRVKGKEK